MTTNPTTAPTSRDCDVHPRSVEAGRRKTEYLYDFESLFRQRCLESGIDPSRWSQGMWTNAHMYHGRGVSVQAGVALWFNHVKIATHYEHTNH